MDKSNGRPVGLFWIFLFCGFSLRVASSSHVSSSLVLRNAVRTFDLRNRVISVEDDLTFCNSGDATIRVSNFALPDLRLSLPEIARYGKPIIALNSTVSFTLENKEAFVVHIEEGKSLTPGQAVKITAKYYIAHALLPSPRSISLTAIQKVILNTTTRIYTEYLSEKQSIVFLVPAKVERTIPKILPEASKPRSLRIGPIDNVEPHEEGQKQLIHYELQQHLGYLQDVQRRVDVSLWGNVAFHERHEFKNEAAALEGEFSRYTISTMINQIFGTLRYPGPFPASHIVFELDGALHRDAFSLQYYDEIGNVSTSHARKTFDSTSLSLLPRFPLLGGWTADWQVEYAVPLGSLMSQQKSSGRLVLSLALSPPFKKIFTDQLRTCIVLPPGSYDIEFHSKFAIDNWYIEKTWSWLDILSPRPTLCLKTTNLYFMTPDWPKPSLQVSFRYSHGVANFEKPIVCCVVASLPFIVFLMLRKSFLCISTKAEKRKHHFDDKLFSVTTKILDSFVELWDLSISAIERNGSTMEANAVKLWELECAPIVATVHMSLQDISDEVDVSQIIQSFKAFQHAVKNALQEVALDEQLTMTRLKGCRDVLMDSVACGMVRTGEKRSKTE